MSNRNRGLKKVWVFLWEEENIWSWLANVLIFFILIKYLLYPGLGWVLGTPAPIVAVVSGSMEHDGNFASFWSEPMCCNPSCSRPVVQGKFYEELGVTAEQFRSFDFVNGFNKGDIMILVGPEDAKVGDVIVYTVRQRPDPIIHRIVKDENGVFTTKGDHNCDIGGFEREIPKEGVIGKAVWRVPLLGWVKILAVNLWAFVVGGVA